MDKLNVAVPAAGQQMVFQADGELEHQIEKLHAVTGMLEERLAPALRPFSPREDRPSATVPEGSPLFHRVANRAVSVQDAVERLGRIVDHLDI